MDGFSLPFHRFDKQKSLAVAGDAVLIVPGVQVDTYLDEAQDVYLSMLPVYYHWQAMKENWPATAEAAQSTEPHTAERVCNMQPADEEYADNSIVLPGFGQR